MEFLTQLVQFESAPGDPFRPTSTPIYQSATFEQEFATSFGDYDYSRSGNPTRDVLQNQLARLDEGVAGFAFASGMAATTCMAALVPAGSRILIGADIYGGTYRFMERIARHQGVEIGHVDTTDLEAVKQALTPETRLLFMETPTNPMLQISDLRALARLAQANGTLLAVDATLMSPYLMKPLSLGADIVMHSATKALSGHADLMAGALVVRDAELAERIGFLQNAQGTGLGPFECFLLLRGMKTLGIRMEQQQRNARHLAQWLRERNELVKVVYPGFDDHPGHDLHVAQADGPGPVISVLGGTPERAVRLVEGLRLFRTTVSFGSLTSTVSLPYNMSHASIPEAVRNTKAFTPDLVRLSVGIEDVRDLQNDLDRVLGELGVAR